MSPVEYKKENDLHIIKITGKSRLTPIVRDGEELFSATVQRAQSKAKLTVCINGCWYGLTDSGKADAFVGHDPVPSADTLNEGFALLGTGALHGHSAPNMFYIAQKLDYTWFMGQGDLTKNRGYYTGIGGLCPLVFKGLKYGDGNLYSKELLNAKLTGEPLPAHKPFLTQRNNNRYAALSRLDNRTGRGGMGFTPTADIVVIAQEHGVGSVSFDTFRDTFIKHGCTNACAVDGSDSVFLWYDGGFKFMSAENKDETQTFGIGIRAET
ncbi:hypothetical protein [Acinetobacter baumannii]|uniref:hypothetical protein n=1 Tax=Acinetobacter baumannii TaxID=470 RepID=UPI0021C05978|nr:hypothetical protein [Acinetobacter baumannii]MDO7447193.1 hypothetical protein [Acinetobacter baumannii]MDV7380946.1 hypothetical protein [Acinetobacter baumannii]